MPISRLIPLTLAFTITAAWLWPAASARAEDGPPLTRIIFGSCADQKADQRFWQPILNAKPDRFLFIGDNVYGDVDLSAKNAAGVPELKAAYAALAAQPGYQALTQQTRVLATWDDHDYGVNDGGADFDYKHAAEDVFEAFFPAPKGSARDSRPGVYDAEIAGPPGKRVQTILLDTRFFRSKLVKTKRPGSLGLRSQYAPDPDPKKTFLGEAQWRWLADQLKKPADVRLIVSSIQVLAAPHPFEQWANLPLEQDRLFQLIRDSGANGVILLSGDRHQGGLYARDGAAPYPLYELTASSFNRPLSAWGFSGDGADEFRLGETYIDENYGQIDIDWAARRVTLSLRDLTGGAVSSLSISLNDLRPKD